MDSLKKIVISGPESTGKSWLTKKLGEHFQVPFADEYARHYLEENGPDYDFDTLEKIIKGHKSHQLKAIQKAENLVFLDTDLLNFKIWEELVFGKTHDFIEKEIEKENDHIYLLTYPDIPWEKDPLRENPNYRLELFEINLDLIKKLNRPYQIVKGDFDDRFENALSALEVFH
ncbi:AAA family ATPase [Owenweeksia hongkongensis]|uniref:AAA family ATPase n=1 Tax=Owenweeksia hongkongensis TaxID=253245 RepID=UPI003A8D6233